ncbi:MAG: hypothetical protein EBR93_04440 [Bacteroidetes bacterium]|nr:hypothetical protein [Bacteroidota bacterium]
MQFLILTKQTILNRKSFQKDPSFQMDPIFRLDPPSYQKKSHTISAPKMLSLGIRENTFTNQILSSDDKADVWPYAKTSKV